MTKQLKTHYGLIVRIWRASPPQCFCSSRGHDHAAAVGAGYKGPEVAGLLSISAHTVSSYVRDIYRKLGISSRAEAAMEAARRGLVA